MARTDRTGGPDVLEDGLDAFTIDFDFGDDLTEELVVGDNNFVADSPPGTNTERASINKPLVNTPKLKKRKKKQEEDAGRNGENFPKKARGKQKKKTATRKRKKKDVASNQDKNIRSTAPPPGLVRPPPGLVRPPPGLVRDSLVRDSLVKDSFMRDSLVRNEQTMSKKIPIAKNRNAQRAPKRINNKILHQPQQIRKIHKGYFYPFSNAECSTTEPFNTMYPNLYRIFTSSSSSSPNISLNADGKRNSLMNVVFNYVGTRIEISQEHLPQADVAYVNSLKNRDVHIGIDEESIEKSKIFLVDMEKHLIVSELKGLLSKVEHQSKFLKKQLYHMSSWSKENFTDEYLARCPNSHIDLQSGNEYTAGGLKQPNFASSVSRMSLKAGVSKVIVDNIIAAPKSVPLAVKVKIKCEKLKKPDTRPLPALMIPLPTTSKALRAIGIPSCEAHVIKPKVVTKVEVKPAVTKKIRAPRPKQQIKPKKAEASVITAQSPSVKPKVQLNAQKPPKLLKKLPVERKSYDQMGREEKLTFIRKILRQRLKTYRGKFTNGKSKTLEKIDPDDDKITDNIEKDEDMNMDSSQFWEMTRLLGYWKEPDQADLKGMNSTIWQPELPSRAIYWGEVPTPRVTKQSTISNSKSNGSSLYNRLQSLLVAEEGSSDEKSDVSSCGDDEDILSLDGTGDADEAEVKRDGNDLVDLSALTLEERTYIHLRSARLIDHQVLPSVVPSVIEDEVASSSGHAGSNSELDVAIHQKQMKLSHEYKKNNTTVAKLLDQVSGKHKKGIEQEDADVIAKYNQATKARNDKKVNNVKEKRRIAQPKSDDDWTDGDGI
uniref:Uncharacterized protein n=1 Tax=Chaetoceros debilis TaxID=122233 RepID=A0A7S3V5S1_9STRA